MTTSPFEIGDIVMIIPKVGCNIGAEWCRIPVKITWIERAAVEPEIAWDIEVSNQNLGDCPYFLIYCPESPLFYDLPPVQLLRDQVII